METKTNYGIKGLKVLTEQDVEDLMVTAMEGGSNYWYDIQQKASDAVRNATKDLKNEPFVMRLLSAISRGVTVQIHDIEDEENLLGTLTAESWAKGEAILIEKYRSHLADAINENMDATTGDVFFQLALMGEIVYG